MKDADQHGHSDVPNEGAIRTCRCIDWFSEGDAKLLEVDGIRVTVKLIGRKARRARIAIEVAPATQRHHESGVG